MFRFSTLQKMTLTALLLALYMVATRFLGIYVTPFVRFSFGIPILIFSSILLGPISGAIIGGVGDILGILIINTSGVAINPFMTISYALMGATPGVCMMLFRKYRDNEKISFIIFNGLLAIIWILILSFTLVTKQIELFNKDNRVILTLNVLAKSLIISLSLLLLIGISIFTYFFNRHFKNKSMFDNRIPNIYNVSFIVVFIEVFFTLLLNSLNKWLFYEVILGQTAPFILIFFPALLLSVIYIPMNTILVSYLCLLASKTIKYRR